MSDGATITKKPRRRWLQFNLRMAFVAITLVCLALGFGFEWSKGLWSDAWVAKQLEDRGAEVRMISSPVGAPLKYLVGDEVKVISEVVLQGRQFTDADVAKLVRLEKLKGVELKDTSISLVAAGRLAEHCAVTPTHLLPSEENYAYSCSSGYISTCLGVMDHEWALRWKLLSSRSDSDPAAERRAYEQCIKNLGELRLTGLSETWAGEEICVAKLASLEMQLAVLEQDPARAIQLGEAWQRRVQGLQLIEWPTRLDPVHPYQVAVLLLATRLTREVRGQMAVLQGNRQAELAASDAAIATIRSTLQEVLGPTDDPELQTVRTRWTSSLVIAVEAEQLHRAQVAGDVISIDCDAQVLRRLRLARDDLLALLATDEHCRPLGHRHAMLCFVEQLIFEASRRHPSLAKDQQFERDYTAYLEQQMWQDPRYTSARHMTPLIAYLLRREERTGVSATGLKQHELDQLLFHRPTHSWTTAHVAPTVPQWHEEFGGELNFAFERTATRGEAE